MTVFPADYPGAQVVPAHSNGYGYRGRGAPRWRAVVVHTPEEDADEYESTPAWFQDPRAGVATTFYADSDGDAIQMVRLSEGAYSHGVRGLDRHWKGRRLARPPWAEPGASYNLRGVGLEDEGRAASIHRTLKIGGRQWWGLVAMILWLSRPNPALHLEGFPLDRDHVCGHDELSRRKHDPGPRFPWEELMRALHAPRTDPRVLAHLDAMERDLAGMRRLLTR